MALRAIKTECGTYMVQAGDTLASIAGAFHTTPAAIIRANRLGGMRIVIGQGLAIPGYCPLPSARGVGMQDAFYDLTHLNWDVPVPLGATVKLQFNAASATADQLNQFKFQMMARGYNVSSIQGPGYLSPVVSVLVQNMLNVLGNYTLLRYANDGTVAVQAAIPGASVINAAGIYSYGSSAPPANQPGSAPGAGASIPNTPVAPGDQVKVFFNAHSNSVLAGASRTAAQSRITNLLAAEYRVIEVNIDAIGNFSGYGYVIVQAVNATTLPTVASAVNYAASMAGLSVHQGPGDITASIFRQGLPVVGPGGPDAPPGGQPGIFDDLAKTIGLSTGLPLTGAVVAGIIVIGVLIFLKT